MCIEGSLPSCLVKETKFVIAPSIFRSPGVSHCCRCCVGPTFSSLCCLSSGAALVFVSDKHTHSPDMNIAVGTCKMFPLSVCEVRYLASV